jgi:hypothetical protein
MTHRDRRTSERINLAAPLVSRERDPIVGPYHLINIGMGGLAVESPDLFIPGEHHSFTFTLGDGAQATLLVRAAHCMRINRMDGPPVFVAGFSFVDSGDGTPVSHVVEQILDAVFPGLATV